MHHKDFRNHKALVEKTIKSFYESFYKGNRIDMYNHLTTGFQKQVPLNYFLVHSDYDSDFGYLKEIEDITISSDFVHKIKAKAELTIILNREEKNFTFYLEMDYGGWKIDGDSLFRINIL